MKRANQEDNSVEELMFADDLVLIAEDQIRLQEMVSKPRPAMQKIWYENLESEDGSDCHQQRTHSM